MKSREPKTTDRYGWLVPDGLELLPHRRPLMTVDRRSMIDLQVGWGMSQPDSADTRIGIDGLMLRWDLTVEEAMDTLRLRLQQSWALLDMMSESQAPPQNVALLARWVQDGIHEMLGLLGVIEKAVRDDEHLYALDNEPYKAGWETDGPDVSPSQPPGNRPNGDGEADDKTEVSPD